jgi:hypothetical protein
LLVHNSHHHETTQHVLKIIFAILPDRKRRHTLFLLLGVFIAELRKLTGFQAILQGYLAA